MRAFILPAAALALSAALVLAGGRMVEAPVVMDEPDAAAIAAAGEAQTGEGNASPVLAEPHRPPQQTSAPSSGEPAIAVGGPTEAAPPSGAVTTPAKDAARSRLVASAVVAPPPLAPEELEREAPREPLSELSLALPPKPAMKNDWAGTPLYRPLAVESGVFESGGRRVSIAGVKSVPLDESCIHEGASWPCGVRARTAFRLWLRGRALVCQLPDAQSEAIRARCRLGTQDAGAWLVANGWAFADPGGPYVQAEEKARAARMGIFGAPPDASSIAEVPDVPASGLPAEIQPVMTEGGFDPEPPVPASPGPEQVFPPAPPSP